MSVSFHWTIEFFEFHPHFCLVKDQTTQEVLLRGTLHNGLYKFNLGKTIPSTSSPASCLSSTLSAQRKSISSAQVLDKWHLTLGHPSQMVVKQVLKLCNIFFPRNETLYLCSACELGKSHHLPFRSSQTVFSCPLELIISDVWGPAHTHSRNGFKYYISFVDAYSRYTWIYFLKLSLR